jgi:phosphatidylglycerophosphate synthase
MKVNPQNLANSITALLHQNLANSITALGIILTFWLNFLIRSEPINPWLNFIVALAVIFSDLDGRVARWMKTVTPVGDFLDRVRDKFLAGTLFVYFLQKIWLEEQAGLSISFIKVLVILILVVEALAVAAWIVGFLKGSEMEPHLTGKIKITLYFIAIGWWFFLEMLEDILGRDLKGALYGGLIFFLLIGLILGILSILAYSQRYGPKNN